MTLFNVPAYLDWPAQFCLFSTAATWIASLLTHNVSQVDRLWTFLPTIYTAYYALLPILPNQQPFLFFPYAPKELGWNSVKDFSPRALLILSLVTLWMFRLSYNTYRRGLFNLKDEDYRWAVLRSQLHPVLFQITNLTFIAATQNVLLLLLGLPTYVASVLQPHTPLSTTDYQLALQVLVILAFEFTADNQQYSFHDYKHAYIAKEKGVKAHKPYDPNQQWPGARLSWSPNDAKRGFVTRGLWRYSRHPNFACEQSFWWLITLLPLLSPYTPTPFTQLPSLRSIFTALIHSSSDSTQVLDALRTSILPALWYFIPCISLSILFFSSTLYTEQITSSKYPAYAAYQKRVGMFLPVQTWLKMLRLQYQASPNEATRIQKLVWGAPDSKDD